MLKPMSLNRAQLRQKRHCLGFWISFYFLGIWEDAVSSSDLASLSFSASCSRAPTVMPVGLRETHMILNTFGPSLDAILPFVFNS
jgi:hypothetical protein